MRYGLIVLWMLFCSATSALAQVSIGIGLPGVSIGINLQSYPELVRVPGYPVYYAPRLGSNFFFYDGMYWVYERDNWYAGSWYNGPWGLVSRDVVPLYVLRIPVRYYRDPPAYFRGWRADAPPRWGQHWGNEWEQQRRGWDKWNRNSVPAPAPLPVYQRKYAGDRYPRVEQQPALHSQNYRYQPRDAVVRQHYQEQAAPRAQVPAQRGQQQGAPQERSPGKQDSQRSSPPVQERAPTVPRAQPSAPAQGPLQQRGPAAQDQRQQPQQGATQREQQTPRSQSQQERPQGKGAPQEQKRSQGQAQEKDREKGDERGQDRKK